MEELSESWKEAPHRLMRQRRIGSSFASGHAPPHTFPPCPASHTSQVHHSDTLQMRLICRDVRRQSSCILPFVHRTWGHPQSGLCEHRSSRVPTAHGQGCWPSSLCLHFSLCLEMRIICPQPCQPVLSCAPSLAPPSTPGMVPAGA